MKWLIFLAVVLPSGAMASMLNNSNALQTNQPFKPGYNASTQRMQNQMRNQQQNQQLKLQQEQQQMQQKIQEQRDQAQQRTIQLQPGNQTTPQNNP
ncbi:hypothetical protein BL250_05725 [Erwinia sp. OLTSP20]|uniref:DUF2756 domain-containing protein n=1 Tax=unclassified Erwinia TaxID=2622719 RepID=UPI000C1A818E|nr:MULTISPECIES: DUF2756 domain-containing protein [unclassified Erwinia]PIJ51165.1 hypothetical protein BV501_05185 [Erwinia sp. OAMSP11]PIJ73917.1 hypothetical protein BK416_05460 [Erwinia sp. OLSSP12]PIJ83925.1 hypothetical protein BLD47_03085 [Erwinia sp. OLCASP19]PIJ86455.1 hypothetical protein BLD46_03365 [Erwinia sp. OLMTSP26]PIJ87934.1 hypothetical protein BLD49_04045 [Erwinia sp. OLMDSP33]